MRVHEIFIHMAVVGKSESNIIWSSRKRGDKIERLYMEKAVEDKGMDKIPQGKE